MRRTQDTFQTVKTEGAILPADLLRRIVDGDTDVPGLSPEDYHLAKSERLNEAATRAWNRLQGAWEGFKEAVDRLPESDAGTSLTRERWLLILFQELGYGRLTTRKAYEIEGKSYPISHEWQNTPIHLVSFRQEIDKRTPGRAGAARVSPHSLVQELLSRSDDHLWGLVSNGLTLRLLRDNVSLTRQAYVEFDLQAMMDSEAYSDFFLLFLLCHQSRVEVPEGKTPESCWLEKWCNTAAQQGVRALDQLRDGVQNAIEALGGGFLAHPANADLREKLRSGRLSTQDYYRQVLRQVYRLLFVFVAEDRDLLFDPQAQAGARKLYTDHYSTQRLRALAAKTRGTRHPDLWCVLRMVLSRLYGGCEHLAVPALGSFLFAPQSTPDLNDVSIANKDLLKAIRSLAFTIDRNVLRPINYRHLGPEELGSVYESLLEMHPTVQMDATNPEDRFKLTVATGSERKTTGSYYTPTSLVNCLLDSALDPVLDEACRKDNPEQALLDLKVCDPACGSGHFLIAAAHRTAKRLAAIRAGEDEPSPGHYQHALRDVICRCIYGVDINPMAVELCKINLWMEALEPSKPLTFLDHHIQCGNSLVGTTPALMKRGIPDEAFKPIEGDDKAVCRELKQRNKEERKGQGLLMFDTLPWLRLGNLVQSFANLTIEDDSTPEALAAKEQHYIDLVRSTPYESAKLIADTWCAAFVCEKRFKAPLEITEAVFRRWEDNPHHLGIEEKEELAKLREQYHFFHWHLAFPEIFKPKPDDQIADDELTGWSGGFDCMLGNPPWERVSLKEREWFSPRHPQIAEMDNTAQRRRAIADLEESDPFLFHAFMEAKRQAEAEKDAIRGFGLLPLCGRGDVNTYAVFAELNRTLISATGRVGCIIPSGIATDDTTKLFFQNISNTHSLISLLDFENREGIFPAVDSRMRFCLLTLAAEGLAHKHAADFLFFAHSVTDLADKDRHFALSAQDIALLNPNTRTCPIFRSKRDAELTKHVHRKVPSFMYEDRGDGNPWEIEVGRMFHTSGDSELYCNLSDAEDLLCLYESKFFWQFDHRYASFNSDVCSVEVQCKRDANYTIKTQHYVPHTTIPSKYRDKLYKWYLTFRKISNVTNERTVVSAILPYCGLLDSATLVFTYDARRATFLLCDLNSLVLDYTCRQAMGGSNLTRYILLQLPVLPLGVISIEAPWDAPNPLYTWAASRSLELSYTAHDIEPFAHDCSYDGPPFRWDEERRFLIRCELDAAFFHLYLGSEQDWKQIGSKELLAYFPTPRDAVEYINRGL